MKRILAIGMALIMVCVMLAGCGGGTSKSSGFEIALITDKG
ncbi:MAG: hypothetical protein K0R50_4218, partial [Eubacterium sp.]|nr:hypothetical protein [Eubacterium sp.]